jgi:hypothetical protein
MTIVLDGSQGISTPMYNGAIASNQVTPTIGFKNKIINGGMVIDQRNAGASSTPSAYTYTIDRWALAMSQASKITVGQNLNSVTSPVGFTKYLGFSTASAYTVGSGDYFFTRQWIEGLNIADLAWGTSNAKTVTLSFQVYSSLTGTFGGAISNQAGNRSYPFSYTISSANTWTTISVTIAGDITGTWATDNSAGIAVIFSLGAGSTYSGTAGAWAGSQYFSATGATSVVGTNGATFYITGVQLEVGSSATSFDYRPYGTELALCQRYYQTGYVGAAGGAGGSSGSGYLGNLFSYPVTMRVAATVTQASQNYTNIYNNNISIGGSSPIAINGANGFGHGAINGGGASAYYFTYTASAEL